MRKLVALEPRVAGFKEYEDRPIQADEVLIKVAYASPKHGTEVADFRGVSPFINEQFSEEWNLFVPRDDSQERGIVFGEFQLGNMIVGEITEKGSAVTEYEVGDIVCTYGPIQETLIAKAVDNYKLRKMTSTDKWKNAVCYDPAQFAMAGVRDANVRVGDFVAVSGLGAIGQIAVQLAKKAGAIVFAVDPLEHRRDIALKNGADFALDSLNEDIGFRLKELTDKQGMDSIIETSGNVFALQAALRGIAYGGTIAYVAFAKEFNQSFNLGREAHFNNAKLVFSRASSEPNPDYPRWNRKRIEDTCWRLLMENYIDCEDIIAPVIHFNESDEAYMKYVDQQPDLSIKMGITF